MCGTPYPQQRNRPQSRDNDRPHQSEELQPVVTLTNLSFLQCHIVHPNIQPTGLHISIVRDQIWLVSKTNPYPSTILITVSYDVQTEDRNTWSNSIKTCYPGIHISLTREHVTFAIHVHAHTAQAHTYTYTTAEHIEALHKNVCLYASIPLQARQWQDHWYHVWGK